MSLKHTATNTPTNNSYVRFRKNVASINPRVLRNNYGNFSAPTKLNSSVKPKKFRRICCESECFEVYETDNFAKKNSQLQSMSDSENDDDDHNPEAYSTAIIGKRLQPNTVKQYKGKIAILAKYLQLNYSTHVVDGVIVLPLPIHVLLSFLGHISIKSNRDGVYAIPKKNLSYQHVNGFHSAIKYLYGMREVPMEAQVVKKLGEYLAGYKREVAQLKERGEMPMGEGKAPMSGCGYEFLASTALKQSQDFTLVLLCHTFLLFAWNLMARAVTVSAIIYDHITWEEDALVIRIGRIKNDQDAKNMHPRHVYANPLNPTICPVLSLALLVFCKPFAFEGTSRLVFGESGQSRFSEWLGKVANTCHEAIVAMGLILSEIGTHSFRKGVATFLSSCPSGPTAISIWLRAGWSLGAVQSRYIFEGPGGDQFVGRAATGLDLNSIDFAILPPHFNNRDGPALTNDQWNDILPGYETYYPQSFRVALPYLLASLVYHSEWLQATLPAQHPLFRQRVWTSGTITRLKSKVHMGKVFNPTTGMKSTGIPPSVVLLAKFAELTAEMQDLRATMTCDKNELLAKLVDLPEQLRHDLLNHFQVNGAIPLTSMEITNLLRDMEERLALRISTSSLHTEESPGAAMNSSITSNEASGDHETWTWGGRFHMVPEDFVFPKTTVAEMWNLWWKGFPNRRIGPLRFLKQFDVDVKVRSFLSRAKKVMDLIVSKCLSEQRVSTATEIADLSDPERDALLADMFVMIWKEHYPQDSMEELDRRRLGEKSYLTWYDIITARTRRPRRVSDVESGITA